MADLIQVDQYEVVLQRRRGQRNMNLTVRHDGTVRVSCNLRRSEREVRAFVESCRDFIERRKRQVAEMEKLHPPRKYLSGELFLWRGERLPLSVVWSWHRRARVDLGASGKEIEMLCPVSATQAERHRALVLFYRAQAKKYLSARVEFWSRVMDLKPSSVTVRGQRTLWGSCTSAGAVSLNWKLMCAPPDVIDYVVVHELAHLRQQNHSPRFWAIVEKFIPEHKARRAWLKEHQQEISRAF